MEDKFKDIPEIIKRIRISSNLTQEELAKAMGSSRKRISEIENGRTYVEFYEWVMFCKSYEIPVATFSFPNFLLVNDQESNLLNMKDMLSEHKDFINIYEAGSDQEAWDIILKNEINLTVINLKTPATGGMELTKKIKANKEKNMPVILASEDGQLEELELMKLGVIGPLMLPFNKEQFLETIPKYLLIKK